MQKLPNAFNASGQGVVAAARTLRELMMVRLSASIRSKPEWWAKYKEADIRAKWKAEALATKMVWFERATMLVSYEEGQKVYQQYIERNDDDEDYGEAFDRGYDLDASTVTLSDRHVEYVLDELDGYAKLREQVSGIQVSCFDGVWQCDKLIDSRLRDALIKAVSVLEDVPEDKRDWHPGSKDQVLDLVHPSLYCVVYNRTPAYPKDSDPSTRTSADLEVIKPPNATRDSRLQSLEFQWLPTDFKISQDGSAKALGYINNLHPSHTGLYQCIEKVLSAFIPMFERVLTDLINPLPFRIEGSYEESPGHDAPGYPTLPEGDKWTTDYDEMIDKFYKDLWWNNLDSKLPDIPEGGYPGGLEERPNTISLVGKTVQVIVKLANIHLTPENTKYEGGSWHLEGMMNERIIASGIYYYDQENITSSELAFRIAVEDPELGMQAEGYDYDAHYGTWGFIMDYGQSTKLNNCVGAVETSKGRCIAFPNTYQHRVSSFELSDAGKPGYRKILALFLVDPSIEPIPSTSQVPPQQKDWALRAVHESGPASLIHKLPVELLGIVSEEFDLMDEREAKQYRLELMKERTALAGDEDERTGLFARTFNLCEH